VGLTSANKLQKYRRRPNLGGYAKVKVLSKQKKLSGHFKGTEENDGMGGGAQGQKAGRGFR